MSIQVTRVDTSQSPSNERTCLECGSAATEQTPTGHWFCTVCHTAFRRADLNQLLIEVEVFASRYVVFTNEAQAVACVLFAAYTHAADQFDVAPYVAVTAPEKQSGKTRLLEVLGPLCARTLRTSSISPAALYRTVADRHPTLLIDEGDTMFGKGERADELRGLINAGHRRGNPAIRMKGSRGTQIEEFDVFGPKVFAAIGKLPETIADRCIQVRLQRKRPGELVERFRQRRDTPKASELGESLADVLSGCTFALAEIDSGVMLSIPDRAADIWEPLLAVAERAGGDWPERAERAALALTAATQIGEEDSAGLQLLSDIRSIWPEGQDRISSADLIDSLVRIEDAPWLEWYGSPLTAHRLARLLRKYEIRSKTLRLPDGSRLKGYELRPFSDAWERYLPSTVQNRDSGTASEPPDPLGIPATVSERFRHDSLGRDSSAFNGAVTESPFDPTLIGPRFEEVLANEYPSWGRFINGSSPRPSIDEFPDRCVQCGRPLFGNHAGEEGGFDSLGRPKCFRHYLPMEPVHP